ncbi:MAG: ferritin-like domain-containing protein [Alphaproteobacteria bacterium]|nr:ferritin-like domain-containing protein [Alphaproteobacteria bacterium]
MKNSTQWEIADLPWNRFDAARVSPDLLKIVKAAALVEYNAHDYATYLANVFPADAQFRAAARQWATEETRHGAALGAWARRADPDFNFEAAFERYKAGYAINVDAATSIRGSRTGELIARCIVETGTSSYYTALGDAADEPVLKALCRNIAADELRHYKLFHGYLQRYAAQEGLSRWQRLKIGLGRMQESEDDELAFAYFSANAPAGALYDRPAYSSAYMVRAFPLYRPENLERVVAMVFRACGIRLSTFWRKAIRGAAHVVMRVKVRRALSVVNAAA